MPDYKLLEEQLHCLIDDTPHPITNYANASALIYDALDDINWAGFYFLEDSVLILGPFQGKPACTEIPVGNGVCGTAVAQNKTQLVPDVHKFPGHIACDSASNSEIVIPLRRDGVVYGVLDIDSPSLNRFSEDDKEGLEKLALVLSESKNC